MSDPQVHHLQVLGFRNATDGESDVVDAIVESGDYDCVTFFRTESGWLGAAFAKGSETFLHFAIDDGPPLLQAALDGLMTVFELDDPEGVDIVTTVHAKLVEADDG